MLNPDLLREAATHAKETAYRLRRGGMASPGVALTLEQGAQRADEVAAALIAAAGTIEASRAFTLYLPEGWYVDELTASSLDGLEASLVWPCERWSCSVYKDDEVLCSYGTGASPTEALQAALKARADEIGLDSPA
jgi:hypothetical protein